MSLVIIHIFKSQSLIHFKLDLLSNNLFYQIIRNIYQSLKIKYNKYLIIIKNDKVFLYPSCIIDIISAVVFAAPTAKLSIAVFNTIKNNWKLTC